MWNSKLKDFLEDNKNITMLGLALAGYWRLAVIAIVIIYDITLLGILIILSWLLMIS